MSFNQYRTNPGQAVSNFKGRTDTPKAWPSTAVSTWMNGGLFGGSDPIEATGGTKTTSGDYTLHTFTSTGTFVISAGSAQNIWVAGVASGGGSGDGKWDQNYNYIVPSGGGGGGEVREIKLEDQGVAIYPNWTVTIPAGVARSQGQALVVNDGNSNFLNANGGGKGADGGAAGSWGGNGGGGGGRGETYFNSGGQAGGVNAGSGGTGYGNAGGVGQSGGNGHQYRSAGGGGGAGAVGQANQGNSGGNGGVGYTPALDSVPFGLSLVGPGGGGGMVSGSNGVGGSTGGAAANGAYGNPGTANTGGGGGGNQGYHNTTGGAGGSGKCVIAYLTAGG